MSRRNSRFQKAVRREQREEQRKSAEFIKDVSTQGFELDGKKFRLKNRKERRG